MARCWNVSRALPIPAALVLAGCGSRAPVAEEPGAPEAEEPAAEAGLPEAVSVNVTTCQVTLTLRLAADGAEDPGPGLRSLLLHVEGSTRIEPHAERPDGSPVTADAPLARSGMERLLAALVDGGFFARSRRLVSARHASPLTSRPEGAGGWPPAWPDEPHVQVVVTVHDVDWHHHWAAPVAVADGEARLAVLGAALEGRAAELVAALTAEVARAAGAASDRPADGGPG